MGRGRLRVGVAGTIIAGCLLCVALASWKPWRCPAGRDDGQEPPAEFDTRARPSKTPPQLPKADPEAQPEAARPGSQDTAQIKEPLDDAKPSPVESPRSPESGRQPDLPPWEVADGFAFISGLYIPPPYTVAVDADGIKVNGHVIQPARRAPKGQPVPKEDPGPFPWTPETEGKGMDAPGFAVHVLIRFCFWEAQHGRKEAMRRVEEYMRQQPFIAKMEWAGDELHVWTKTGEMRGLGFSRSRGRPPQLAAGQERRELEEGARLVRDLLSQGGAVLVGGAVVFMPANRTRRVLPLIYEVVSGRVPSVNQADSLTKSSLLPPGCAEAFVRGFKDSPELAKRIELIGKQPAPDGDGR